MKVKEKEQKSTKTLKGQLFGAVAMMLVAVIALGTSTYAWFINNQAVEVQTMELTVSTATSLLAAVGKPASVNAYNTEYAAENYTKFKTVISNGDIKDTASDSVDAAGWTNFFTTPMAPSSVCNAELAQKNDSIKFPAFFRSLDQLVDGQVSDFELLTHDTWNSDTSKFEDNGIGQGSVKHLRLAFQGSASDLDVYLGAAGATDAANKLSINDLVTAATNGDEINGKSLVDQAAAIKYALRMAIVPVNPAETSTAAVPVVFQFDDGTTHLVVNGNNTYYGDGVTGSVAADETTGLYKAIQAINDQKKVSSVSGLQTTLPANNAYVATVTAKADGTYNVTPGTTPLFTLKANTPQVVDVYLWLEGTDMDCLNELSSYHFGLNIPFVATESAVAP